jgi:transposase-like protein
MIQTCFVLGLSTSKVAAALLAVLDRLVSAGKVRAVAESLDAVGAFHRRPRKDGCPVLMLDGVVLSRKRAPGPCGGRCW